MNSVTQRTQLNTLLSKYYTSARRLQRIQATASIFEHSPDLTMQRLRQEKEEQGTVVTACSCDDSTTILIGHECCQSGCQLDAIDELEHSLCKLSVSINSTLYRRLYKCKMATWAVQTWLDDLLWNFSNSYQSEVQKKVTVNSKPDITILSQVLDTLFSAERSVDSNNLFPTDDDQGHDSDDSEDDGNEYGINSNSLLASDSSADIRGEEWSKQTQVWILNVASVYLKYASISDYKYLVFEMLKSRHAMDWGASLIQYIPPSNSGILDFMAEYVVTLRCILDKPTVSTSSTATTSPSSPWTEDDYMTCLYQLDLPHVYTSFVNSIFQQTHPLDDAFVTYTTEFFDISNDLVDVLLAGINMASSKDYSNLTKSLTQHISRISIILTSALQQQESWSRQCHSERDDFILRNVTGLLSVTDSNIWHFLPSLPFHVVSVPALWEISLKLLQITDYAEPSSLRYFVKNPPNIDLFTQDLKKNGTQGVFMVSCLANLATSIPPSDDDEVSPTTTTTTTRLGNKDWSNLGTSLVAIISYALFTVAFVDPDLNDFYYKDVRDNFGTICACHPFVISLLLRWTCVYLPTMEKMALYLFRSLPINRWHILKDDLALLHQLLRQDLNTNWVTFAQYVIAHLNFGYSEGNVSRNKDNEKPHSFQSWCQLSRQPFLSFEIHQELAFILLDCCQKYRSLYDFDKYNITGSVFSSIESKSANSFSIEPILKPATPVTINASSHQDYLNWCWTIMQRLQLYHSSISSQASDMDSLVQLTFLRDCLNQPSDNIASHGALLAYVAFILSPTSRHFLRFECGHGWMKLLLILRRGCATAAIDLLGTIVPAFVFLHGDDFFTGDDSLVDYLHHMVEHKKDPMLRRAALDYITMHREKVGNKKTALTKNHPPFTDNLTTSMPSNGVGFVIGSHAWHCRIIDSVNDLNGFSYLNLILFSWLRTVLRKEDWMWHEQYVTIVDDICYIAYCVDRKSLVVECLEKEMEQLEQCKSSSSSSSSPVPLQSTGSPNMAHLIGQPRKAFKYIKNMLPDTTYATLLTGEWSVLSLTTSNIFKTPGVEIHSFWFAFEILLLETAKEKDERYQLVQLTLAPHLSVSWATSNFSSILTPLSAITKSANGISPSPSPSPSSSSSLPSSSSSFSDALLLFQENIFKSFSVQSKKPVEFYCIYRTLQHILVAPMDHPVTPLLLQLFFCLYFSNVYLEDNNGEPTRLFYGTVFFIKKQDQLAKLRDRIASLQTHYSQKETALSSLQSSKQGKEMNDSLVKTKQHYESLRQVYYAMWLWLGDEGLVRGDDDLSLLPPHFCPDRLRQCLQPTTRTQWESHQPWSDRECLWNDLMEGDKIKQAFDRFCWIDADNFV